MALVFSSGGPPHPVQMGLVPDEHFAAAWNLSLAMGPGRIDVFPLDQQDLAHAAAYTATHRGSLAQRPSGSICPVRALWPRLWPTTLHLQKAMHPHVHRVSRGLHVALPGSCDPPCLLAQLLAPGALRCRIIQVRPVGTNPSASTSRPASILVPGELPQRRCQSDGVVGVRERHQRRRGQRIFTKDELDHKWSEDHHLLRRMADTPTEMLNKQPYLRFLSRALEMFGVQVIRRGAAVFQRRLQSMLVGNEAYEETARAPRIRSRSQRTDESQKRRRGDAPATGIGPNFFALAGSGPCGAIGCAFGCRRKPRVTLPAGLRW